jgi:hypothetical protein
VGHPSWLGCRAPDDQLDWDALARGFHGHASHQADEEPDAAPAELGRALPDGGEGWIDQIVQRGVVEAHNGELARNADACRARRPDDPEGQDVSPGEDRGRATGE